MPAAYTTLTLTDGTTTCNLVDGTNYALTEAGWAPAVAPLRRSTMASQPLYDDVEEAITVNVMGSTGAAALANLMALSHLLDQADRWSRGEPVSPVLIKCQPQGSNLAVAVESIVLGRADETALTIAPTFADRLMVYEISDVTLRFRRRGQWLGAAEASTAISAQNPAVQGVGFSGASLSVPAPLTVRITASAMTESISRGLLLVAATTAQMLVIPTPTGMDSAPGWSSVADTNAIGGAFLRYTAAGSAQSTSETHTMATSFTGTSSVLVAAVVYTTADALVGVKMNGIASAPVLVPAGVKSPMVLGVVPGGQLLRITAQTQAGALVDIDSITVMAYDRATSGVVLVNAAGQIDASTGLEIVDRSSTHLAPAAQNKGAITTSVESAGDLLLHTTGVNVATVLLAVNDAGVSKWALLDSGTTTRSTLTLNATRRPAYLVPQ